MNNEIEYENTEELEPTAEEIAQIGMPNISMSQSNNTGKVSNALAKVQMEMGTFSVDKAGYNFNYLTLAKMLEVILPISGKNNLSITQFPSVEVVDEAPWITILTRIACEDEYIDSTYSFPMIEPSKKTDTDIMMMGSTISYMRRFALQSILCIAGSDKDPEEQIKEKMSDNDMKLK